MTTEATATKPTTAPTQAPNPFQEIKVGTSKEMPSKIALMGVPKIGKSRLAAEFPDAFFLNIEDGLNYVGKSVRATPKLETYEDVIGWLKHIYESETFKAGVLVLDTVDWLENLARVKVEKAHGGASINDQSYKPFSYGAGMSMVAEESIKVIRWLDAIYKKKGISALLLAHSQVKSVDLPTKEPFSRYELKLSKALGAKVYEWADLILFADYDFHVSKEGKTSEPKPMLFAGGSASFVGGGRMRLSKTIPLNYEELKKEITR